ncbi:hypothetical protein KEM52_002994, partial [Ascosphaera acerosa]
MRDNVEKSKQSLKGLDEVVHRLVYPMPQPGFIGALLFSGEDVMQFLRRYEQQAADHKLSDAVAVARLPEYCTRNVRDWIKSLPEYSKGDFKGVMSLMKREFYYEDSEQRLYTRQTLLELVLKSKRGLLRPKHFVRDFQAVGTVLLANNSIDEFNLCTLFLEGLPRNITKGVVVKQDLDFDKPEGWQWAAIYSQVKKMIEWTETEDRLDERAAEWMG